MRGLQLKWYFLDQIDVKVGLHSEESLKFKSLVTEPSLKTFELSEVFKYVISCLISDLMIVFLVKSFKLLYS